MPSIIPVRVLTLTLFSALLLFPNPTFSIYPPESSPSPSPQLPPPPTSPSPSPAFLHSPPAPPPSVSAPDSPSPAPSVHKKSPSPATYVAADQAHVGDLDSKDGSGGMSGGKKAGIAIGIIAGGCVVVAAALLYKKRQHNIRRGQYGYAARGEYL